MNPREATNSEPCFLPAVNEKWLEKIRPLMSDLGAVYGHSPIPILSMRTAQN